MYPGSDQIEKTANNGFRVVYICSAARSGSTVTDMFLGGHSRAASLGEINLLGKSIKLDAVCGCGSKLRACVQWGKIFDAVLESHGIDLINDPYGFRLWDTFAVNEIDYEHQTRIYRLIVSLRRAWMQGRSYLPYGLYKHFPVSPVLLKALQNKMDLYRKIARCWQKSVLIDSSKSFREAVELHQRWPGIVKVILLTRDGRGVYLSRRSSGRSQQESINDWIRYYRLALPLLENQIAPESLLKIRYEDLASDPEKIGHILCDFIDIAFESEMLDLTRTTRHLVNSNKTKFFPEKGIQLDERWQSDLRGKELDFFERNGGKMNYLLGYR